MNCVLQATAWAALSGIGLALVLPCVQAIVAELYTAFERGRAFGTLFTVSALGATSNPSGFEGPQHARHREARFGKDHDRDAVHRWSGGVLLRHLFWQQICRRHPGEPQRFAWGDGPYLNGRLFWPADLRTIPGD